MIPPNGYIRTAIITEGYRDENGFMVPESTDWSNPIACRYRVLKLDYTAISEGERYTDVRYEVMLQSSLLENMPRQNSILQLLDLNENIIAERRVISSEHLSIVKRIKIIV